MARIKLKLKMNRIKEILVIGLFFLIQPFSIGQTNQPSQFLQKVGVLDSLYSQNLKEYKTFYVHSLMKGVGGGGV